MSIDLGPGEFGPTKPTSERYAVGYRGVPFSEWLALFLEYALGLAHSDRFTESYKVCESARDAVIFSNSKEDMFLIHVTWAGKRNFLTLPFPFPFPFPFPSLPFPLPLWAYRHLKIKINY